MSSDPWQLPPAFATRVIESLGLGPVSAVDDLRGFGSVNAVFRVVTSRGLLVVRANPGSGGVDGYRREAWCQDRVVGVDIAGPRTLACGVLDDASFMVQTFVDGVNASTLDPIAMWTRVGELASRVHLVPYDGDPPGMREPAAEMRRYIEYNRDCLDAEDPLLSLGVLTGELQLVLRERFCGLLLRSFPYGLCHGDLTPRNVIRDPDGRCALIDWGCASFKPVPHWDLSEMRIRAICLGDVIESHLQAFLRGYGLTALERASIEADVQSIMLLRSIDLVRWAIGRSPADLDRLASRARMVLATLLPALGGNMTAGMPVAGSHLGVGHHGCDRERLRREA